MTATKTAAAAAKAAFDAYLIAHRATATMYVPQCVIDAAEVAYRQAGGTKRIVVAGWGNTTHPVCGVEVRLAKRGD